MEILKHVQSLLPSIERDDVIDDIESTRAQIKEHVQPAYETAAVYFKNWKFKSDDLKIMIDTFSRNIRSQGNANMVVTIERSLDPAMKNLDEVQDLIKQVFSTQVSGGGLTYLKSNLLQFVECMSFVSRFSMKLLNYIYICETAEYEQGGTSLKDSLTKAEIEWLQTHFYSYCLALRIVSGNPGQVRKQLLEIPDIVVQSDNAATLVETLGSQKIDPLGMGFIPVRLNPIYHIRMFVAKWQADRYKATKEELALIQLRKLNLEQTAGGKPDALTQQEINVLKKEVEELNYKIAKMEEDYA